MSFDSASPIVADLRERLSELEEAFERRYIELDTAGLDIPTRRRVEATQRLLVAAPKVMRALLSLRADPTLDALARELAITREGDLASLPERTALLGDGSAVVFERLDMEVCSHLLGLAGRSLGSGRRLETYLLLLEALMEGGMSEPAAQYFERCSTLLLLGLDFEVAVMCRASLEAALKDRLSDRLREFEVPFDFTDKKRQIYEYALDSYLIAATGDHDRATRKKWPSLAREWCIFHAEEVTWAYEIKNTGNDVAHAKFAGQLAPATLVVRLARLLRRIFPAD